MSNIARMDQAVVLYGRALPRESYSICRTRDLRFIGASDAVSLKSSTDPFQSGERGTLVQRPCSYLDHVLEKMKALARDSRPEELRGLSANSFKL
jgi:hypothetical protein